MKSDTLSVVLGIYEDNNGEQISEERVVRANSQLPANLLVF